MRLTWKDAAATLLVAAIVVPYVGYLTQGSMPFIQDPEGMAAVGLVLGVAAYAVGGWLIVNSGLFLRMVTVGLGLVSLALGIGAAVTQSVLDTTAREGLLATFIASIVILGAVATLHHSGLVSTGMEPRSGMRHA